jgi:hypothetical protein
MSPLDSSALSSFRERDYIHCVGRAVRIVPSATFLLMKRFLLLLAPLIVRAPLLADSAATANSGQAVTFTVTAQGTNTVDIPFSYQWMKAGAPVPGATGPTLALTGVSAADAGAYTCTVSNAKGQTTSDTATLSIAPMNTTATLTATITSTGYPGPALYTWRLNGKTISGTANSSTYQFDPTAKPGSYTLEVTWPNPLPPPK